MGSCGRVWWWAETEQGVEGVWRVPCQGTGFELRKVAEVHGWEGGGASEENAGER